MRHHDPTRIRLTDDSPPSDTAHIESGKESAGRLTRLGAATILTISLLAACAGGPPPPEWKLNAQSGLESFTKYYLDGNDMLANLNFAKARSEAARTGRPDLLARIELSRCGVRAAALDFDTCPAFEALKNHAQASDLAYATFLTGQWQGLDVKSLPARYAPLFKSANHAGLTEIADPTSRLIAAGILFRSSQIDPAGIALAVSTASERGWRRPLLAWLGIELKRTQAVGDLDAQARIQQRIDLVNTSTKP